MSDTKLESIRGVGQKRAQQLEKLGVHSIDALLSDYPRDYLDYASAKSVGMLEDGMVCAVQVRILAQPAFFRKGGMSVLSARAADETGTLMLKWFNQPYRRTQIHVGETVYACGRVQKKSGLSMLNPSLSEKLPGILPVYATVKGVPQRTIREAVFSALQSAWDGIGETLPPEIVRRCGLCTRQLALRQIHFPSSMELLRIARRRVQFEQALFYLLSVEHQKAQRARSIGISFETRGEIARYLERLPFTPTKAQMRVMHELAADMSAATPMNRLLQGDVGSGKTAVALFALFVAVANGYQSVLLAPTEILAQQHDEQARALFGDGAVILTGGMKKAERDAALARIAGGEAKCIVGTHALFAQSVRFQKLGLVVTDEQHRFGVQQRAAIQDKGVRPDVLVMSATPIPRTLSLLLYGDLDVSVIDGMPPGRKPIKTALIEPTRRADLYRYVGQQAAQGVQTYVVCPLIEESETLDVPSVQQIFKELTRVLPTVRVAMLHGRMKEAEKQSAIDSFRAGCAQVLVTTTVIEVGVHVESACIMVVEGADRFGLSQLHQLRGRVGRGAKQAYCFLLTDNDAETARQRLDVLVHTTDGFEIAQRDLELRGPGDFIGTRQHGEGQLAVLTQAADMQLVAEAAAVAKEIAAVPTAQNNALIAEALRQNAESFGKIAMN